MPETIVIGGWKAVPQAPTGFYIYDRRNEFRGYAPTEESARGWLDESSGEATKRLPVVKVEELRQVTGKRMKLGEFPCRGWYRLTQVYLGDKHLGTFQITSRSYDGRDVVRAMTSVGDGCVSGHHLDWLLKQNGYRLEVAETS